MKRMILLLGVMAYQAAAWPYLNPKVTSGKAAIRKAVVLPAQVTLTRIGAKGPEGGLPEADQIADAFYSAVAEELSHRGVEVAPNPLRNAKDDADRYTVADLQSRSDTVRVQIVKKPTGVEKGRYTLGDRVGKFEPAAGSDALVFLRGQGYLPTPGRKAVAIVLVNPFAATPTFHGDLTFVDAKTGEVLAFVQFTRTRNMTQKTEDRFAETLRISLQHVPFPLPPGKK
jgi:hypothetical protein